MDNLEHKNIYLVERIANLEELEEKNERAIFLALQLKQLLDAGEYEMSKKYINHVVSALKEISTFNIEIKYKPVTIA